MSDSHKNQLSLEKFFELSIDLLCIGNTDGYFLKINKAFEKTFGYSKEEILNKQFYEFIHPDDINAVKKEIEKLSLGHVTTSYETRVRCKNGSYKWVNWSCFPEIETGLLYAVARDVTEQKVMQEKLIKLSTEDTLTQVLNRHAFETNYSNEFQRALKYQYPIALLIIDIDEFKTYNDNYGHIKGDKCLVKIAQTLKKHLSRAGDLLGRYGGDEFIAFLPHHDLKAAMRTAEQLRRSIENLKMPHQFRQDGLNVATISIGVTSHVPTKPIEFDKLLNIADKALYYGKDKRRNNVTGLV